MMFNVRVREMMNYGCLEKISEFQLGFRTNNLCNSGQTLVDGHSTTGLEINEKILSRFCDRIPKFSCNLATFSRRIFASLRVAFSLQRFSRTKYEPTIVVCTEVTQPLLNLCNAMFERSNIAAKYAAIKVSSD